ncbi:unnamed protein product [Chondrus crispus]|uniref:Uncharacterized protein n=1 Tax=Chondrus crispus TaxID=2769 RepID=R7QDW4_CHOCR|nr:unnamed protein product [Chondrus crispus]CDF36707.1 unnamed protein product [Chondrus crispus]|eukprot:XP_005716526.1 unnamed protein product [Chondrus crispus]
MAAAGVCATGQTGVRSKEDVRTDGVRGERKRQS